jgi:hypothetical protein
VGIPFLRQVLMSETAQLSINLRRHLVERHFIMIRHTLTRVIIVHGVIIIYESDAARLGAGRSMLD